MDFHATIKKFSVNIQQLVAAVLNLMYNIKAYCSNTTAPVLDISASFCVFTSCVDASGLGDAVDEGILEEGSPISTLLSIDL